MFSVRDCTGQLYKQFQTYFDKNLDRLSDRPYHITGSHQDRPIRLTWPRQGQGHTWRLKVKVRHKDEVTWAACDSGAPGRRPGDGGEGETTHGTVDGEWLSQEHWRHLVEKMHITMIIFSLFLAFPVQL